MQHQSVALSIYAITTLDMVSEAGIAGKIFQAGVMKFMRAD